jgi:hypothetical protein
MQIHRLTKITLSAINVGGNLRIKVLLQDQFPNRYTCTVAYAVEQLVGALCYKPDDRGFKSRWGSLGFFFDLIFATS